MSPATINKILKALGVNYSKMLAPQSGYRNSSHPILGLDGRWLNLIIYKQEPDSLIRIQRADAVSNFLASRGTPCRQTQSPIMKLKTATGQRYARLYNYLPGSTIAWEAYIMRHLKLLGKAMSNMHAELAQYQTANLSDSPNTPAVSAVLGLQDYSKAMQQYFSDSGVTGAMASKLQLKLNSQVFMRLDYQLSRLQTISKFAGQAQPLHLDFVRGNVLFSDQPATNYFGLEDDLPPYISGIIDMEKTSYGPPIIDIARTLAFLLVDCKYKSSSKIFKYFVQSGYSKRGRMQLDQKQLQLLRPLVQLFLLHDFYKFLKHNPYQSLSQNDHFVRTRDILLKNGIIQ